MSRTGETPNVQAVEVHRRSHRGHDLGSRYFGFGQSTPAIDLNVYYVASGDAGALHAVDWDGNAIWTNSAMKGAVTGLVVGLDGTIYVTSVDDYKLWAINPNGSVKWETRLSKGKGNFANIRLIGHPALDEYRDAEGVLWTTIYVGTEEGMVAVNGNGTVKWTKATDNRIVAPPAIGADGIVYVQSQSAELYAIAPDGTLLWSRPTIGGHNLTPAIGANGTLYVGATDPDVSGDAGLYAFEAEVP